MTNPQPLVPIPELKPWKVTVLPFLALPRKLLLIRPKRDSYTNWTCDAAALVRQTAVDRGWQVTDLVGNDATRDRVVDCIGAVNPNLIIHYDHGNEVALHGQKDDQEDVVFDMYLVCNARMLDGRAFSTVSCSSASQLGPAAVDHGCRAYLGYNRVHSVPFAFGSQFALAANAANIALLVGATFSEAFDYARVVHTLEYLGVLRVDPVAAALLLANRDALTLLGNSMEIA
jgi:hypothetical protein